MLLGWIRDALEGRDISTTAAEIDTANAKHAEAFAGVGVNEAVALLRDRGSEAVSLLRSLDADAGDARTYHGPAGREVCLDDIAAMASRHPRIHLEHAKAALSAP